MQENLSKACNISITDIASNSVKLFFVNIAAFSKYLAYPILGQLLGFLIIFFPLSQFKNSQSMSLIPVVIICTIVGLVVFVKAFWRYLIATIGLNLMSRDMILKRPLAPFETYTNDVNSRSKKYVVLLFQLAVLSIIPVIFYIHPGMLLYSAIQAQSPSLISNATMYILLITTIVAIVYAPFLTLVLQSFTFEKNVAPFDNIKISFMLVRENYFKTLLFLMMFTIVSTVFGTLLSLFLMLFTSALDSAIQFCVNTTIGYILTPMYALMLTYWYFKLIYKNQECATRHS